MNILSSRPAATIYSTYRICFLAASSSSSLVASCSRFSIALLSRARHCRKTTHVHTAIAAMTVLVAKATYGFVSPASRSRCSLVICAHSVLRAVFLVVQVWRPNLSDWCSVSNDEVCPSDKGVTYCCRES